MQFISRNIEAETVVFTKLEADFQFKETFNCKELVLDNPYWDSPHWATSECLNSDQYTRLRMFVYSNEQLLLCDEVLKNWMKGGHEKLEMMDARTDNVNVWSMLDGYEQTPTSFSEYELQLRSKDWQPTDVCLDIRRPTDGRLATFSIDDNYILLLVWHEKYFEFVSEETRTKLRKLKLINK